MADSALPVRGWPFDGLRANGLIVLLNPHCSLVRDSAVSLLLNDIMAVVFSNVSTLEKSSTDGGPVRVPAEPLRKAGAGRCTFKA